MRKFIKLACLLLSLNLYSQNGWQEIFTARWFISSDCADSLNCMGLSYSSFKPRLYFTNDAGATWKQIFSDSIIYDDPEERIGVKVARCISFPSPNLALIGCDSGHVLRTTDNGKTWSKSNVGKRVTLSKIIMRNENEGIAFDDLYLHKTDNGGMNWREIPFPTTENNRKFYDFAYTNGRIYIYFAHRYDNNVHLWYSDNDGVDWAETNYLTRNGGRIYAVDKSSIWVLPLKLNTSNNKWVDYVIYSSDEGRTWGTQIDSIYEPSYLPLEHIKFYDNNHGIIYGNNGEIHRTTDGGLNWFQDRCSLNDSGLVISSASYLTQYKILLFTENGIVFKFDKNTMDVRYTETISNISFSPNPAGDYVEIKLGIENEELGIDKIIIYNVLGECVLTTPSLRDTPSEKGNLRIDVTGLAAGVYFVKIGEWTGSFVKVGN